MSLTSDATTIKSSVSCILKSDQHTHSFITKELSVHGATLQARRGPGIEAMPIGEPLDCQIIFHSFAFHVPGIITQIDGSKLELSFAELNSIQTAYLSGFLEQDNL